MNKKRELNAIFNELCEGLVDGEYQYSDVIEVFKTVIEDTLRLKIEFGFTQDEIKKLRQAADALSSVQYIDLKKEDL